MDDRNLIKHLDVFREIGNIGAGNAASALARILNRRITMTVPESSFVPFSTITNVLDGPETLVAGVLIDITGDLNGYILLVIGMKDAMTMVSQALGEPPRSIVSASFSLTDMESDTLDEIANIIVGSFLSAIATFTGLNVKPSVPQMSIDMLGAIISVATIEYGKIGDSVLFLKTQFNDIDGEISGHFFLIPDYDSYRVLINSLGLDG
jgi:chemotaxis protein CheC